MTDWTGTTLGEMCSFRAGMVFKREEQGADSGDVPFIKVSDMNLSQNEIAIREANNWVDDDFIARHRAKPFPAGTVVFAKIGEALKQNRVRRLVRPTLIDNNMMGALANQKIVTPEFLYYRLAAFDIASTATGTALPYLTVSVLQRQEFLIPSIKQQRRIASILSAYDDLIENNTRRIAILEEMARRIYEEWFVRFRFPGHEGVRMVESKLGPVPEGWVVRTIADVCESVSYGYTASAVKSEVGPHFLRITDIVPSTIDWDGVPFCEMPKSKASKYLLRHGDIVVARTGATTGYAKRLNRRHPETVFASYLVRVRTNTSMSNLMLGTLMQSDEYKQFIKANIGGAAQPQANAVVLTSMQLVVPPLPISNLFDQFVEPMIDEVELLSMQNRNLRTTRDLLLPKLISGELDVSELPLPEAVAA